MTREQVTDCDPVPRHMGDANVSGPYLGVHNSNLNSIHSSAGLRWHCLPLYSLCTLSGLQAAAMLLRLPLFRLFPLLLIGFVYNANAQQQQISGTSLYPEELIPLITRADALLTAGQFNDAAKAYSEAIGEHKLQSGFSALGIVGKDALALGNRELHALA